MKIHVVELFDPLGIGYCTFWFHSVVEKARHLFITLRLGHGYLKTYLKRIGQANSNLCRCGVKETAKHLLVTCSKYLTTWPAILKSGLHLSLVLKSKENRAIVLQFIQ
jgi:hypothetical protein